MDHRLRWATAAGGILALVGIQQGFQLEGSGLLSRTLSNTLHIPMFVGVASLVAWLDHWRRPGRVFAVCLGIAAVTEILQLFNDRSASLQDVGLDMIGTGLVLAGILLTRGRAARRFRLAPRAALPLLAFIGTVATLAAPGRVVLAYMERDLAFPVLFSPDRRFQHLLWEWDSRVRWVAPPAAWPGELDTVLEVTWVDKKYPGITFHETVDDWSGYSELVVEAYLTGGEAMTLTAAVGYAGVKGTSAQASRTLHPGFQRLSYPLGDLLETDCGEPPRVRRLILHASRAYAGRRVLLGQVYLKATRVL